MDFLWHILLNRCTNNQGCDLKGLKGHISFHLDLKINSNEHIWKVMGGVSEGTLRAVGVCLKIKVRDPH